MPASNTVCLISRATCLSESRASRAFVPTRDVRTNKGPKPILAIRAASDVGGQDLDLREFDVAVLAAVAYHQPVTHDGLKDIFGKEISHDLIGRLYAHGLIATGPRRGAPYTFVTTEQFLTAFDLRSLRDLPDREQLFDAGLGVNCD